MTVHTTGGHLAKIRQKCRRHLAGRGQPMVTLKAQDRVMGMIAIELVTCSHIIAQRPQKTLYFKNMIGWGGAWNRGAGSRLREHGSSARTGRGSSLCRDGWHDRWSC